MTVEIKHQIGLGTIHDDALTIRTAVFVAEQGVPMHLELDNPTVEATALHIVAYVDGKLAGTARVFEEHPGIWHVQRVATLYPMRGQGIGRQLVAYIEKLAPGYHIQTLELGAQIQAKGFYENLGFQAFGDEFYDANILHINMKKELV
ncbi:GNAT family N-acetyltransferase [Leuconostoc lactis]|uniref:GNAT family N-acetyltransferase n=1 Tax=Leuconostoc lactis TaxID=1246 RepID=UPI00020DA1E0|nr:GNAT family N-acetyltransferase [Leuconostoc lactis]MCT3115858.1 GNAT family N-acetyltransferase [Leuconostoc lactis]ORI84651.1 GNAT family N-acetyltransferase [Leuconostoc lactis]ORI86885.1 GNAT family N-acetyltransferase [Leuconostoc lactis]